MLIDAKDKKLGRIASEVASLLMGKDAPGFARNKVLDRKVTITNASKLAITPKKTREVVYTRYTGYPGGLKHETMEHAIAKKGHGELLKRAVRGMLPNNKLRPKMLQNLIIEE